MTLKEQLRANFPKTVNKTSPVFSSMIANDEGTGAFEYELNRMSEYMKEWVSTPNVYEQSGDMLDKTISFFSFLERFTDETETSIKKRFNAVFVRNHDKTWGNPFDVKSVFQMYFSNASVFLIENTNSTESDNLIMDGDFTEQGSGWTFEDSELSVNARFSKTYGISLGQAGKASQSVSFSSTERKTYFLHFFMKGKVRVCLKNGSGKYWNGNSKIWVNSVSYTDFETEEWEAVNLWFILDSSETSVSVEFSGNGSDVAYADYIRLFEKQPYPSFTVLAQYEADFVQSTLKLAPGTSDPSEDIQDYDKYDYYERAFITGAGAGFAQDIYNDLLNMLKAQGVKAYLEIVTKDYIEE